MKLGWAIAPTAKKSEEQVARIEVLFMARDKVSFWKMGSTTLLMPLRTSLYPKNMFRIQDFHNQKGAGRRPEMYRSDPATAREYALRRLD